VLGLVAASAGADSPRGLGDAPALGLVWFDPQSHAWGTELVARAEAAAVLTRMGASVAWRSAAPGEMMSRHEVWVILVGGGPQQSADALVLGATRRRPTAGRVVWIRVPNVGMALGVSPGRQLRSLRADQKLAVGVALGRVIAHEVVHSLVPSLPHGAGLMSGSFTRRHLTGGSIDVEPEVTLAFRAALRGDPVVAPPGNATVAAVPAY
jgi:hypothetical protein